VVALPSQIRDGILVGDLASGPTNAADNNPALPPGRRPQPSG
jgi:hypothetical protein